MVQGVSDENAGGNWIHSRISDAEFWAWRGQWRQNYTLTAGAMGEAHYWTESNASRTVASRDI